MHLDNLQAKRVWSMDIFLQLLSPQILISSMIPSSEDSDFRLMIIGGIALPNSTLLTDRDSLLMAPK